MIALVDKQETCLWSGVEGPTLGERNLISKARSLTLIGFVSIVMMAGALGRLSIIHTCAITKVKHPTVSS